MKVVLTIAGSDSGGGAGIQADLKTFEAHGVFGTTVITAVTAQTTVGVRDIHPVPVAIVAAQLDAVFDDFTVDAIKVGMLASREIVELVAKYLSERAGGAPVVVDPVMVSTSGDRLVSEESVAVVEARLIPLATIITPNSIEAGLLTSTAVVDRDTMRTAAAKLVGMGARSVLIKGGHIAPIETSDGPRLLDLLIDGTAEHLFETPFIDTTSTHGTGCTLSSAIAARLATGDLLLDAVLGAQTYVQEALRRAPGLGHGNGPLLHRH